MNKWLLSFLVIAVVFLVFQLVVSMKTSDIETPKYEVLKKFPLFELRQYESMMLATTNLGPTTFALASNGKLILRKWEINVFQLNLFKS